MIENKSTQGAHLTGSFKYPKMEAEQAYETSRFGYSSIMDKSEKRKLFRNTSCVFYKKKK